MCVVECGGRVKEGSIAGPGTGFDIGSNIGSIIGCKMVWGLSGWCELGIV